MIECIRGLFWFVALFVFGYPLAFVFAIFYVFFQPFQECCASTTTFVQYLLKIAQLPLIFTRKMITGEPICR
ncbi:venom toxin-like peptide-6 [Dinothrombium tinctorium]|uniref:Venom toxin-like peptide-6 n=1 Tax=Dinothrombium tinctorium TaxID=1965070 RepID=A0A3S3PUE0_9ACAR|nr:venom toxin-like peptide-6 [Dinothrombium tinctorium]RWS16552.1 venom toxin-like peptide-6 [Dinothrombium tinctorium]